VHEGVAFPVLWWLLDKQGNSDSDERMRFMETFAKRFPTVVINDLCADREFIGQAWVRDRLLEPVLAFRLRMRGTDQLEHDGKVLAARGCLCSSASGASPAPHRHLSGLGLPGCR